MRTRVCAVAGVVEGGVAFVPVTEGGRKGEGSRRAARRAVRVRVRVRACAASIHSTRTPDPGNEKAGTSVRTPRTSTFASETLLRLLCGPNKRVEDSGPWTHRGVCPAAGQESAGTCGDDGSPPRRPTITVQLGSARA
jgi:hypothetical protein